MKPDERPSIPKPPWHSRLNAVTISLAVFLVSIVLSLPALRGSGRAVDVVQAFLRFAGRFFPPDFAVFPETMAGLGETFQIAVLATLFAIVVSIPLGILGARSAAPIAAVAAARMALNLIRTMPSLIWALIGVAMVGSNPLAGVIGLTLYSVGYLGKFFADAFESVDRGTATALKTIGANWIQSFQYGLWPHAKPLIWSYSIWMLEYNIRSASIVGLVGAGGLGVQLVAYQEYGQWDRFATVLLVLLVTVTLLDLLGEWIRKQITGSPEKGKIRG
jgi:phosphonate ABC transporter permease subunit PhnE